MAKVPGFTPYSSEVVHSGPVDVGQAIDVDNLKGKTIVIVSLWTTPIPFVVLRCRSPAVSILQGNNE
jgi:hypothetical protein